MQGIGLTLEGKLYRHSDLNRLPAGHKLIETGHRTTGDGETVFFCGKNSYLSNFAPCHIRWGASNFSSSEQLYQYRKALAHNEHTIAARIISSDNPYVIKKISNNIKVNKNWESKELGVLYDVVMCKFKQNHDLRQMLLSSTHKRYYEHTLDKKYGIGLKYKGKIPPTKDITGKNEMGKILSQVKLDLLALQNQLP